jgi:hypothetical protein
MHYAKRETGKALMAALGFLSESAHWFHKEFYLS